MEVDSPTRGCPAGCILWSMDTEMGFSGAFPRPVSHTLLLVGCGEKSASCISTILFYFLFFTQMKSTSLFPNSLFFAWDTL